MSELRETFGITEEDERSFVTRGKPVEEAVAELEALQKGRQPTQVHDAARYDNGFLMPLDATTLSELMARYKGSPEKRFQFFIPAAGAASRQFQMLKTVQNHPTLCSQLTFTEIHKAAQEESEKLAAQESLSPAQKAEHKLLKEVATRLPRFWQEGVCGRRFAFLDALSQKMGAEALEAAIEAEDLHAICEVLLDPEEGLGYAQLPKVLLPFHSYTLAGKRTSRTALEEHIRTWLPIFGETQPIRLHFALSEEHQSLFAAHLDELKQSPSLQSLFAHYGRSFDELEVSWSIQQPATDAVALSPQTGQMARHPDGSPLMRKAGHGALLPQVEALDADGIWIHNIDNILYDNPPIPALVRASKKIMAGLGLKLQEQLHESLRELKQRQETGASLSDDHKRKLRTLVEEQLQAKLVQAEALEGDGPEAIAAWIELLDRPLVVAGYVPLQPNQKGGGPFVLTQRWGSLQVKKTNTVEGSEFANGQDNPTFQSGICFNPVNLFVMPKRYDGSAFRLQNFSDPQRFFLSHKSDPAGNPLLAYERPGLWNGALAQAFQVSIGTPANTFCAVKDTSGPESFLSPLHQPGDFEALTPLDHERGIVDEAAAAWLKEHTSKHHR